MDESQRVPNLPHEHVFKAHCSVVSPSSFREKVRQKCLQRFREKRKAHFGRARSEGNGICIPSNYAKDVDFHAEITALVQRTLVDDFLVDDYSDTEQIDWSDFMVQLERDLCRELEEAQLDQLTQFEEDCTAAAIASANRVPCPVCQHSALQQLRNVIYCRCGLRLNLSVCYYSLTIIS